MNIHNVHAILMEKFPGALAIEVKDELRLVRKKVVRDVRAYVYGRTEGKTWNRRYASNSLVGLALQIDKD